MPRLPRFDRPGLWFHVFHRGIARRPVFETVEDVRYFLACLARAVRRGEIEVHAYCILTTHFHLLVRSPTGNLSRAMDRVLNAYVRYYNRTRRRDGSLFRGRFGSRPVRSLNYRWTLVRYIDRNAVQARLASRPWEFPYCSAWHYVRPRRPRWLETRWVDGVLADEGHEHPWEGYASVFGRAWTRCEAAVVRGRMQAPANREDVLDDLIAAAPPQVLAWMRRKAKLADGTVPSLPCVDARSVITVIDATCAKRPSWRYRTEKGHARDAWPIARAYLLRHLAALAWDDIGRQLDVTASMAARRARQGQALIVEDGEDADRIARLAREILDRAYGSRRVGVGHRA